jgi:hypothetical protein
MMDEVVRREATQSVCNDAWKVLSRKRVFFGHQSVGFNIVEGIKSLTQQQPQIELTIIESTDPANYTEPVFGHCRVGRNLLPDTKCDHFARILDGGLGERLDIAFFKLCYIDISRKTVIGEVVARYKRTLEGLRMRYPKLILIPMTVPLTYVRRTVKTRLKSLLRIDDFFGIDDCVARSRYNEAMRREFEGDALFDLAGVESTTERGSQFSSKVGKHTLDALCPAYTSDGGHLNELGSRFVAGRLLDHLVGVSDSGVRLG